MILVDSSVWIDHLRKGDEVLRGLLENGRVLGHPFIRGELALGSLRQPDIILGLLENLPQAAVASDEEVMHFIRRNALPGSGIGYVDAHLLAAVRLTPDTALWTRDQRLARVAERLHLDASSVQ